MATRDSATAFHKENSAILGKLWNFFLRVGSQNSLAFFEFASGCYKQGGRGSLIINFPNVEAALDSSDTITSWIPFQKGLFGGTCDDFVERYDPETHFVLIVYIAVTEDEALYEGFLIEKDVQKLYKKIEPCTIREEDASLEMSKLMTQETFKYGCQLCGNKGALVKCITCGVARYCSAECKKFDRKAHKSNCKLLVRNKTPKKV